ncbi:cyclic nucleotide-binding domain-containing protein [Candidatus Albibeggiatoa sp. nov. NOAA]|uniref:cyclic nucleotide-binding domain-containing protein n=1 Tax=Candidatus Albibeggiatoa sp. nov. NOAA TaxID=3162724 RepID=UPI0032FE9B9B|nr:cyclic nucleotide-binding domain-containing protein [Thiotrichaceae bacterium]
MVANSLFLEKFSAENLSYVYLASSLLLPLTGLLHLYFEKRISYIKLQSGTLVAMSMVSLMFLVLLWVTQATWLIIALYIWLAVEIAMTDIVLWGTANRLFTVRQSKRLFGLIGTGGIITVIVGGLMTPYIVALVGTRGLLFFSFAGFVLAFINLRYMNAAYHKKLVQNSVKQDTNTENENSQSFTSLFKNRYLVLIFLFFTLYSQVIYYFLDNIFYFQINSYFPDADELSSFIGQFWAVYGIGSLLFRSLAAGRWMSKVGLHGGMLTAPLIVGFSMLGVVIVDVFSLSPQAVLIFWLIAITKLFDRILTGSVTTPAYHTLYQPLSLESRARVQTMTESIVGPLGGILTSLSLLFLTKVMGLGVEELAGVLLAVVSLFVSVSILTIREYRKALTTALSRRGLIGTDLSLDDNFSVQILENGLQSHRPKEILYCLKLLEEVKHHHLKRHLFRLIHHEDEEVREGAYRVLERSGYEEGFLSLKRRLAIEDNPCLRAALLRSLAATSETEAFDIIEPYLDSEDSIIRQGAMVALIRYCGIEGAVRAGSVLMELRESKNPTEREFAATVLGQVGISSFYRSLLLLLRDEDIEVRKAALLAAGQLDNRKLWPLVIESLVQLPTREVAAKALIHARESAFPALEEAYEGNSKNIKLRREIVHIYGRIKSKESITLLLQKLNEPERNLRYEILWSLYLCGYQANAAELQTIENLLTDEVFYGVQVINMLQDFVGEIQHTLLFAALNYELEKTQARIFLLLASIYPSELIMKIWSNFRESSVEKRDLALELLDNSVNKTHKAIVLPVLEVSQVHNLPEGKQEDVATILQWVIEILSTEVGLGCNAWIKTCAIDAAMQLSSFEVMQEYLTPLLHDDDNLVRETAWTVFLKQEQEDHQALDAVLEKVKVLKSVSIFSQIPDEILAEAANFVDGVEIQENETVFLKGELGTTMYVIADGLFRVHDKTDTLAVLGKGHIFGELSALDPEHRNASVTAIEKSYLFKLSQEELNTLIESHIEVAKGIIQILCQRLKTSINRNHKDEKNKLPVKPVEENAIDPDTLYQYSDVRDELTLIEKVIILKTVSIFADTPDNILSDIGHLTKEVYLTKGETLFHKGEVGTSMYVVVSGKVKIHDGEQTIAELGERALLGEMAVLSSEPRTASVTAVEDTVLLSLSQSSLFELMWDQHKVVRGIIRVLIQRLRSFS